MDGIVSLILSFSHWDHLPSVSGGEELVEEYELWTITSADRQSWHSRFTKDNSACHMSANSTGVQSTVCIIMYKVEVSDNDKYLVTDFSLLIFFRNWKISEFWRQEGRWRKEISWCYQQQKHKAVRKSSDPCQTIS